MKAAIVHDWFQGFHGSERVVEALASGVFADAEQVDVLTFSAARELLPEHLSRAIVRESRLSRLPGLRQVGHDPGRWRALLPYMPLYFRRLDLSAYDVVVSSSHSCAVQVRPRTGAPHVCYCHTPMRYAWLPEVEDQRVGGFQARVLRGLAPWLRRSDLAAARRVDAFATNSEAVRGRIRAFYDRDARVVPPPVDVTDFRAPARRAPDGPFLWVHRMVTYKQPLLVSEAFRGLDARLVMVGVGPLADAVRATAPPNVEVHGWLERGDLARLYESAAGFVHVGEEDFGITMVEALAAGVPVIGLDRGGARDIVRDGVDGVLIANATAPDLRRAVQAVSARDWDPGALAERAQLFTRSRFVTQMRHLVAAELERSRRAHTARAR